MSLSILTRIIVIFFLFNNAAIGQQVINKLNVNELKLPKETAGKVLVIDGNKKAIGSTAVTSIELDNLDGSTSNIQDQLDSKEPDISPTTSSDYYRGDKTFQVLDKAAVGLGNVDNTSDLSKPVSTDTQTALNLKADDSSVVHLSGSETISGDKTITGQVTASSTTKGNTTCPVMTDTQMLAVSSPRNGDCVYNSTKKAPYFYNTTDSKWKVSGGGGGSGGGIELMLDPSFEDGVTADYTGLSGATVSQITSTLAGTFNEKMMRVAFTSTGSITFNRTTGSGYTGSTAKLGGWFKPETQADVTFEPLINGVHDGRQCALPAGVWTYCFFELPAHVHPGWRLTSPTNTAHNVDVEWTTISISEKFSALVNLNTIGEWTTFTPTGSWTGATVTYTGRYRRVGDTAEVEVNIALTGAPTGTTLSVNTPSGLTVDTSKLPSATGEKLIGYASYTDVGILQYQSFVAYNSITSVLALVSGTSGASLNAASAVSNTAPFTFGSGDQVNIRFSVPVVGWTASSPNILTTNDTFSTDTAALFHKATACLSAEIGCFNTYYYPQNTNTKTICTVAPAQSISSMNTNGIQVFTRAYNAASSSTTNCQNPSRVEVMVGLKYKATFPTSLYKNTGKNIGMSFDYFENGTGFTVAYGALVNNYEENSGFYIADFGWAAPSNTSRGIIASDVSTPTNGYLVINDSKNPAMSGIDAGDFVKSSGSQGKTELHRFYFSSTGVVTDSKSDLVNGNCTNANPTICTWNTGKFSPSWVISCSLTSDNVGRAFRALGISSTSATFTEFVTSTGVATGSLGTGAWVICVGDAP